MTDRAAKIKEIERLRKVDEVKRLREAKPDDEGLDPYFREAAELGDTAIGKVMEGVGKVSGAIDRVTGAPVRAAIGAAQNDKPVAAAFLNQFLKPAETAPSGKDLASKAGLSTEETIRTPFRSFDNTSIKASPAGIAGGVVEAVTDPTMYIPGRIVGKGLQVGAKAAETAAPGFSKIMSTFAKERAVKAATGENAGAIRKLAKVKGKGGGDVDRALANLHKAGEHLLEKGPDGKPVVGWLSKSEDIAERAAERRKDLGKQIGRVGNTVDDISGGKSVQGTDLAKDLREYAATIPAVGKGAALRKRVMQEATNVEKLGPMSFKQAQDIKGQFPYEAQSADVLISDKDVTNRINGMIGGRMDEAVDQAKKPKYRGEPIPHTYRGEPMPDGGERIVKEGGGERIVKDEITPEQRATLDTYGPTKERYGTMKNIADAGTEQKMRTLNRRIVSPSDYAAGGVGMLALGPKGIPLAIANKVARERGSAFAARSADALSRKILKAPARMQKWLPKLQTAAKRGNEALVMTHHLLMNNDPAYRAAFDDDQEP
jgi:hypothetical protein